MFDFEKFATFIQMETKYRHINISDLERIYSFTKSELSEKETLYSGNPNDELKTQIHGLREVIFNIEKELLLRTHHNQ